MSGADLTAGVRGALIGALEQQRDAVKAAAEPLSEADFWRKPVDPGNSVGHLVLHLSGNLNHFVGAQLGGTGYVRDREREFTDTNPPTKLGALTLLDGAVAVYHQVVEGLDAARLTQPHPEARFGTVLETLVHLVAHFALHRGQMSYLARLAQRGK